MFSSGRGLNRGRQPVDEVATPGAAAHRAHERALAITVGDARLDAGQRLAERDRLPIVTGPTGATGECHVRGLEQVRLPRAVRPPKQVQARLELDLEGGEVAQIEGAYGLDHHGRLQTDAAYALSRIGITR